MVGKTPCELLCSFEVKVCNKWLAMNFLALTDIKLSVADSFTDFLISELLVTGSSWPRIFYTPGVLAYHYFLSDNKCYYIGYDEKD